MSVEGDQAKITSPTRIAVIDHRHGGQGRVFDAWDCEVALDYQDDGRTLKVFVRDRLPPYQACGRGICAREHGHPGRCNY